jgi:hypothetical protein
VKIVPQLDTYPHLVSFGETALGKAVLLAVFGGLLRLYHIDWWMETTIAVGLMAYFPGRRRLLVSIAALHWLVFLDAGLNWSLLSLFVASTAYFLFVRSVAGRPTSFVSARPVFCLIAGFSILLAAAGVLPLRGTPHWVVWGILATTAPYLWYFAYALKDASIRTPDGPVLQLGTLYPFWGGTMVPYPKGAADLRRTEAHTARELSITQLKAIKLLLWVLVLRALLAVFSAVTYGGPGHLLGLHDEVHWGRWSIPTLGIPELEFAIRRAVIPIDVAWESVIAHFMGSLLGLSIFGHIIVASCRMAGFNVLRNTYRPLEARTVAEFWNRYYYYFKELLVEFFFFPVFTRYFKKHRRLRVFLATISAATLGNMLYHFLRNFALVEKVGLWRALSDFQVYAFYATVLGLGIGISQLRSASRARVMGKAVWWRRSFATAGVLTFFCLLEIFDQEESSAGLGENLKFFMHLFIVET